MGPVLSADWFWLRKRRCAAGGGCSEAAAMQRARKIIGTGESCVIEIDMTNDVAADEGMVCGGTMRVLIEDASENKA